MEFVLDQILADAGGRPVHVFLIPSVTDAGYAVEKGAADFRLVRELQGFAATREQLTVTDLLPFFLADMRRTEDSFNAYLHPCDLHWSARGHRLVADAVRQTLLQD